MQACLSNRIDPWKLAVTGVQWQGELPLADMPRLSALLREPSGTVSVTLQGGVDEQKVRFIAGHLQTQIELVCQRCLQPLQLPLAIDLRLGLVRSASQATALPGEYDPLLAQEPDVAVSELVEDELILAVPFAPVHDETQPCRALDAAPVSESRLEKAPNPFAELSNLLENKRIFKE